MIIIACSLPFRHCNEISKPGHTSIRFFFSKEVGHVSDNGKKKEWFICGSV